MRREMGPMWRDGLRRGWMDINGRGGGV